MESDIRKLKSEMSSLQEKSRALRLAESDRAKRDQRVIKELQNRNNLEAAEQPKQQRSSKNQQNHRVLQPLQQVDAKCDQQTLVRDSDPLQQKAAQKKNVCKS